MSYVNFGCLELNDFCLIKGFESSDISIDKHIIFNDCLLYYGDLKIAVNNNSLLCLKGELYELDLFKDCLNIDINLFNTTELLLMYINKYGIDSINNLYGNFSFVYINDFGIYLGRDHIGIKSAYYFNDGKKLLLSSRKGEILKRLDHIVVDKAGLCELLGMGPSNSLGKTIYKDLYEVNIGSYLKITDKLEEITYFELKDYEFKDSFDEAKEKLKSLLNKAIKRTLPAGKYASLLSGGIDSTIITLMAKEYNKDIASFSINYEDNNKDYVANSFETSSDAMNINYVTIPNKLKHNELLITNDKIIENLKTAVLLRDAPGMTTIDSSLIYLLEGIKNKGYNKIFSGECSDELVCGYPWSYAKKELNCFPWIRGTDIKNKLINKSISIDLDKYIKNEYNSFLNKIKASNDDKLIYQLNINYFMQNLLKRASEIADGLGVCMLVPFADKDFVKYLYNMNFNYKYENYTEKYILREAYKNILPKEIYKRKKSPYPKSQSKKLANSLIIELQKALSEDSILNEIINKEELMKIIETKDFDFPWYGQLLRKNELIAYLYQIHIWGKEYKIQLDLK